MLLPNSLQLTSTGAPAPACLRTLLPGLGSGIPAEPCLLLVWSRSWLGLDRVSRLAAPSSPGCCRRFRLLAWCGVLPTGLVWQLARALQQVSCHVAPAFLGSRRCSEPGSSAPPGSQEAAWVVTPQKRTKWRPSRTLRPDVCGAAARRPPRALRTAAAAAAPAAAAGTRSLRAVDLQRIDDLTALLSGRMELRKPRGCATMPCPAPGAMFWAA